MSNSTTTASNTRTPSALVTGANKGIGLEVSRQLAKAGYIVWLGSRDSARGEAAAQQLAGDGDVRFLSIDVTDDDSVRAAAEHIREQTGALDVLVNNAGVVVGDGEGLPSIVKIDTIKQTFDVNFYGSLRVTQAVLPLVKLAPAGRIVHVSSTMGSLSTIVAPANTLGEFPAVAYAASKTLLNALTAWFAVELRDTPIKVNSVCPGYVNTEINGNLGTKSPAEGAEVIVRAATLTEDGPSGSFFDINGPVDW